MRAKLLTDYIHVWDGAFNPTSCSNMIKWFSEREDSAELHDTEGYKFKQLNVNSRTVSIANEFCDALDVLAAEYFEIQGLSEYIPSYAYEEVRVKKYEPDGSHFDLHVDVMNHASAKRFLIFILYLNDLDDGYTDFPTLGVKVQPKAGRVVAFPPTWQYPHRGLPVKDQPKYIMMTSMNYI